MTDIHPRSCCWRIAENRSRVFKGRNTCTSSIPSPDSLVPGLFEIAQIVLLASSLLLLSPLLTFTFAREVNITVDASVPITDLPPATRFFGADEPNQAVYPDGRKLIRDLGALSSRHQTYFRTHNLLTTCDPPDDTSPYRLKWGCTNIYTEDAAGYPIYNFTIVDEIFNTYLENDVKPYVQASFMPKALAIDPEPYTFYFEPESSYEEIYVGWSHPTRQWAKWGNLLYAWTKHCLERYGEEEVGTWYWEVSHWLPIVRAGCL